MLLLFVIDRTTNSIIKIGKEHKFNFVVRNKIHDKTYKVDRSMLKICKLYWLKSQFIDEDDKVFNIFTINLDLIQEKHYKKLFVGYFRDTYNYHDAEIILYVLNKDSITLKGVLHKPEDSRSSSNVTEYDKIYLNQIMHIYENNTTRHIIIDVYKKYRKKILDKIYKSELLIKFVSTPINYVPIKINLNNTETIKNYYDGIMKHYNKDGVASYTSHFYNYHESKRNVLFLKYSEKVLMIKNLPKNIIDKIKDKIVEIYYYYPFQNYVFCILNYDEKNKKYHQKEETIFYNINELIHKINSKYKDCPFSTGFLMPIFIKYSKDAKFYLFIFKNKNILSINFVLLDSIVFTEDKSKLHYSISRFSIMFDETNAKWWGGVDDYTSDNYYKRTTRYYAYFILKNFIEKKYKNYILKSEKKLYFGYDNLIEIYNYITRDIFSDIVSEHGTISIDALFKLIDYFSEGNTTYRNMMYERTLDTAAIFLDATADHENRKSVFILGIYDDIINLYKYIIENKNDFNIKISYKNYIRKIFEFQQTNKTVTIEVHIFFL